MINEYSTWVYHDVALMYRISAHDAFLMYKNNSSSIYYLTLLIHVIFHNRELGMKL